MIKLQVIGNLGKDCVVNTVNGKNVINFTVAHTEKYKDSQGNQQEKTTWVDCAYWTDRTAIAQYLTKGKQVFVEGQPEARSRPGDYSVHAPCSPAMTPWPRASRAGAAPPASAAIARPPARAR